jgi:phosphate/sulfate permease
MLSARGLLHNIATSLVYVHHIQHIFLHRFVYPIYEITITFIRISVFLFMIKDKTFPQINITICKQSNTENFKLQNTTEIIIYVL